MEFQQDWIIRQIETVTQYVARVLFQKEKIVYEIKEEARMSDNDLLHQRLLMLLREERLCAAEDLLFDNLEPGNEAHARLTLDFYGRLNALTDEALEAGGLPRGELEEGLRKALETLGIEVLV